MNAPDWRTLSVSLNDRAAIYAEAFPAVLATASADMVERFTHDVALDLRYTFAGAWPTLGRDAQRPTARFVYLAVGTLVGRFRGMELAPGAIVVDDVTLL